MPEHASALSATVIVVFGATGDLFARKIVPSLFYLHRKGLLPERCTVVGASRRDWGDERFRVHVTEVLSALYPEAEAETVSDFVSRFRFFGGDFDAPDTYERLARDLAGIDEGWGVCANKLFYLAVPPVGYRPILTSLAASGLTEGCSDLSGWTRVLVEKPFGDDLSSAREIDAFLGSLFVEEQIYRIDHYLAKELLQGIMDFRFGNNLFEAEWGRSTIESIEIVLNESIGAEKRGAFYDAVGALRDVGQNHLLQMLALVAMEQPADASAAAIRSSRAELIESLRPMSTREVADNSFRAQHAGFRAIEGVGADSQTETYFKIRTVLTGERWSGVPVTMESGKRMGPANKRIVVTFARPADCMCTTELPRTNRVVFTLEPSDGIDIVFYTKKPGFSDETEERVFSFFLYERAEKLQYVEEYGRLLYDAIRGDQTLFVSTREIEAGWRFIDPIVAAWAAGEPELGTYPPDTDEVSSAASAYLAARHPRGRVGVVGLGKMGAGLARNLLDHGWGAVGFNRTHSVAEEMAAEGLEPAAAVADLVGMLAPPRVVWVMVPAGAPVDEMLFGDAATDDTAALGGLAAALSPGDVVIDGGNSHFAEAPRRAERLAEIGVRFVDCGTSGGPAGARTGATLMVGGDRDVYERIEPMLADVAAPGGYRFFEGHGAGHFVKMVHNGIEYGMMQAIAEGFEVLHAAPFDLDLEQVADLYQHRSVVESRLVGWLHSAYADLGDDLEGVSPVVGHSGEGEWTVLAARDLGIPTPIIAGSLQARIDSEPAPRYAGRVLTAMRNEFGGHGLGPGGGPRR
jgi:glucose-6-phosphate 1-dehydrogenase